MKSRKDALSRGVAALLASALMLGLTACDQDEHEDLVVNAKASSGSCGVERWSVKTGTDADIGSVKLTPTVAQTIAYLTSLAGQSSPPANNRIAPTEDTDYVVNATLTQYKLESDSDYHLVITDGNGNTMIAEIPDPACVGSGSPFASQIQSARAAFDARYSVTTSFKSVSVPVQLTGIGFFDFNHGQTGVAPNAIELHPVLNIVFNPPGGGTGGGTGGSGGGTTGGTGGGSTQLIGNGGFETGSASPWSASSGVISNNTTEPPHAGTWDAWLDGYGAATTDTLSQAVSLPASITSATLAFYLHIDTAETSTSTAYDTLSVQLLSSSGSVLKTLATYSNLSAASGYVKRSFDLSSYKGQTVTVRFTGTEDSTQQTSFVIDDVTLTTQ